jgi:hypothetical protein
MGTDAVWHHTGSRSSQGTMPWGRPWSGRACGVGIRGVSIWSADAIRSWLGGLGLLSLGAAKTRTLEQVLLLARGVLCADLLAVDALYRETLF